jgi:DNA-binding response OmpR family regulator
MNRILIVDDDPYVRKLLEVTLSGEFAVTQVEDAAQAQELLLTLQPCAVFLDVVMPQGQSGLSLLENIKADARTRHIPVALVSANAQQADRRLGLQPGADAYFDKPFSPQEALAWARCHKRPTTP